MIHQLSMYLIFIKKPQNIIWGFFCCLLVYFSTASNIGFSAPAMRNQNYYESDQALLIKELKISLENLRSLVNNHETEIRMYDEKLKNVDSIIEGVRDQCSDTAKGQKEQLKGSTSALEERIGALEEITRGLLTDLKQFKTFTSETTSFLTQYKQRMTDLERSLDLQNKNIQHLQTALKAMMSALQVKGSLEITTSDDSTSATDTILYRVKPGDSLEKIARNLNTDVQVIKRLNNMTNDKIIVGKQIKVPDNKVPDNSKK